MYDKRKWGQILRVLEKQGRIIRLPPLHTYMGAGKMGEPKRAEEDFNGTDWARQGDSLRLLILCYINQIKLISFIFICCSG